AQMALAKLYEFGSVGADGNVKPDYVGAAYWYQQASDGGDYEATYSLAVLYRDGSGVAASPATALELLRKAALAGYVPAMVPLSYAYAATRTGVSDTRARYWAQEAGQKDATGHLPKVQDPDQPSKSAGPKVAADGQKVFGALMAMIVLAAALDVAQGSTDSSAIGSGGTAGPGSPGLGGSRGSSPAPVR